MQESANNTGKNPEDLLIKISDKLEYLLRKMEMLQAENMRLGKELELLNEQKSVLESREKELQYKNKMLRLASTTPTEQDEKSKNTELKRLINEYIREVDKCIALLNE